MKFQMKKLIYMKLKSVKSQTCVTVESKLQLYISKTYQNLLNSRMINMIKTLALIGL